MFWTAECDPFVLAAEPHEAGGGFRIDISKLPLRTSVLQKPGQAHVVFLSEGRRVAIDLSGHALDLGMTGLRFTVDLGTIGPQSLALRRCKMMLERRRSALWPPVRGAARVAAMLAVLDARAAGASLREAGELVFGCATVRAAWNSRSDFMKSRLRRLAHDAQRMTAGGYRRLLASPAIGKPGA
ncbi:DUF2285 domain-containing protein [Sphingosinicella sp.]|uniref:DNA -binding domain-containing protein n=1 Tax=Sphingosinicella sp. TaxID=1917971 RepID=UPI0017A12C97|nr:DUF2285 domain-containing protein [Sphingosinicella sp.]MBA4759004.1 DUF2285 domain-containing protein [Sphingosinicella sp.]